NNLDRDLNVERCPGAEEFDAFLQEIDGYLCELGDAQIRDGLHVLGQAPEGDKRVDLVRAMIRLDNGEIPSLRRAVADAHGFDAGFLAGELGTPLDDQAAIAFARAQLPEEKSVWTRGDLADAVDEFGWELIRRTVEGASVPTLADESEDLRRCLA